MVKRWGNSSAYSSVPIHQSCLCQVENFPEIKCAKTAIWGSQQTWSPDAVTSRLPATFSYIMISMVWSVYWETVHDRSHWARLAALVVEVWNCLLDNNAWEFSDVSLGLFTFCFDELDWKLFSGWLVVCLDLFWVFVLCRKFQIFECSGPTTCSVFVIF